MKKKPLLTVLLALVLMIAYGAFFLFGSTVSDPAGVRFMVKPHVSRQEVIAQLYQQGIIHHPYLFTFLVKIRNSPHSLKSGEYLFHPGSSPHSIWTQLIKGTGFYYRPFMIVPGWTFAQLRTALNQADALVHTSQPMTDTQIMSALGAPQVTPEGEFFPETYYYTYGMNDLSVLSEAYQLMQTKLNAAWERRATPLPFTSAYEALIAASLIEKEAYLSKERPIIAGVLVNRLNKNMRLQFDPTIIYGLGIRYDGTLHTADLKLDTPYNTYLHSGLPPTPIAMPSYDSIIAVLHPATHNYYYFVAKGDGSHQFSENLMEHNKAVKNAIKPRKPYFNTVLLEKYLYQGTQP